MDCCQNSISHSDVYLKDGDDNIINKFTIGEVPEDAAAEPFRIRVYSMIPRGGLGGGQSEMMSAWFESGTFDLEGGTWPNSVSGKSGAVLVGNGLTKVREAGHGAIGAVTALEGTTTDTIDFGDVIKTEFTICSVTRYTGDAKGRILNGEGRNWLHGHHKGNAGVAYYDKSITADRNNVEPNTNWVVMCGTNAGSQLKLVNGVDKGTLDGGQGGVELFVNGGGVSENQKSDFAIAEVMVWDRGLTDNEMVAASDYLMNKFGIHGIHGPPVGNNLIGAGSIHSIDANAHQRCFRLIEYRNVSFWCDLNQYLI